MVSETSQIDARILICHYMQLDLTQFLLNQSQKLTQDALTKLDKAEKLALNNMPVSRIINSREFWQSEFYINQHVLDPRADSEILIEALLHFLPNRDQSLHMLDLGTGSGCLILSLLLEYKKRHGYRR